MDSHSHKSDNRERLCSRMDRFLEFINSGDESIGQEVISESAEFHVPFGGPPLRGLAGYMQILGMMRSAYPDIQWALHEAVVEDDKVVARFGISGTHRGVFLGFPPSGRQIRSQALNIYRFVDGKIVEERGLPDIFGILVQIGAVSVPGPE
ncbi:hypothetical protein Micbo1qcDRAFT_218334 [Microdochium bolleyi]|uniref:Ester cyclase n=1 Tax=Microdochium bolleyi TaxID=196109 RepID=A0A136IQ95_9PEZI|nr:hypothetical protein Micbo1qcDRAFT_218334 [Microdochium bolleyi]